MIRYDAPFIIIIENRSLSVSSVLAIINTQKAYMKRKTLQL
jgi:hypothetical protein